ncbi:MAG TPA: diguanylate cyclase [Egicoccus sp.]|nr:diguanylate cyclase [Egicoccus sp.]HSK22684.1 diguanylate cyclase [Egicoccus sp.]
MGSTHPADEAPQRGSESAQKRDEAARLRDESAALRDEVAELRDEIADLRDTESDPGDPTAGPSGEPDPRPEGGRGEAADDHDDEADDRDKEAHERDRAAEQRDQAARAVERSQDVVTVDEAKSRADAVTARRDAASDRRGSEQDRLRAADERTAAGVDRDASADDRRHSEQDRDGSATDRRDAMEEIDAASLDALTATYARGPGMGELERDRSRADRTGEPMTLAFVDVDDLKGTNDRGGHVAGDRLLRQVADVLRAHTRPHDVLIRYGGDEFVCALIGLTRTEAAKRLAAVNDALAAASERGSITVGLAELEAGESLSSLIRRADDALYDQRRRRGRP